jgi:hypothetical protein
MVSLILHIIPMALGVAVSPLQVVAVLIILLTSRARASGFVFALAWVLGSATAMVVALVFAGNVRMPRNGFDFESEGLVTVLLGIGLVVTAWLSWRGRHRAVDPSATPRWVSSVDHLSPVGGAFLAFSGPTTNPKNLALAIAAGISIQGAALPPRDHVFAAILFVIIASATIVTPVAVYFAVGQRAQPTLARWKERVTARAAAALELMLLVLGVGLACKGLYNLLT